MRCKILEVRDEGTHVEVFALSTEPGPGQEYGLQRCGFIDGRAVIMGFLDGERNSSADPFHWGDRTLSVAHRYITSHYDELEDGNVVDVRVILGETDAPVKSDRFWTLGAYLGGDLAEAEVALMSGGDLTNTLED